MNITNKYGPNTTILLPGSCNAHCDFCFWNRDEAKIVPPIDYFHRVFRNIMALPEQFTNLSISGGEPTLSKYFAPFLSRLARFRASHYLERVVLTTHGGNLNDHIYLVGAAVDHINISRHGIGDEANYEIFKTKKIPSDEELISLIKKIHKETRCDVTLNCVIPDDKNDTEHVVRTFCMNYIKYAKSLGADAVSFRKVASNVKPTRAERAFRNRFGVVNETKCPVCRGMNQDVNGFDVRWKGTVAEPSLETNGVYEAIIHPDGNVYTDWGMTTPLPRESANKSKAKSTKNVKSLWPASIKVLKGAYFERGRRSNGSSGSSGCGGGGGKGGCGSGGHC